MLNLKKIILLYLECTSQIVYVFLFVKSGNPGYTNKIIIASKIWF